MEEFASTDYVVKEVAKAKEMGVPLHEVWADSTASMKEMFEGRLRTDLTSREWADDFYKQGIKRKVKLEDGSLQEIEIMDPNMIPANDLLRGSLLKEIRDLGIAGRELQDLYDLGDTDGPAKALFDKFASLLLLQLNLVVLLVMTWHLLKASTVFLRRLTSRKLFTKMYKTLLMHSALPFRWQVKLVITSCSRLIWKQLPIWTTLPT